MLATLAEDDSFGLVAFDDRVESLAPGLLSGTLENRASAHEFLSGIDARGGTELAAGFLEAAGMLNGSGDVLIVTDGQVFGAERILAQARATGIRLFCLGIGSASQDRFLSLLARESSGISRFVTARERVDLAAVDLFASIGRPVASGLRVAGNVAPVPPRAVFAGTPVLLFGETENDPAAVELTWDGGRLSLPLPSGSNETGPTLRLLQGSRLISDWESRYPSEEALAPLEKRNQSRVGARLLALSEEYGLASREMSLVAVVKRAGDRPGELPQTRVVPVGLPQDVSSRAYFGAAPGHALSSLARPSLSRITMSSVSGGEPSAAPLFEFARSSVHAGGPEANTGLLLELAAQLEPDGGLPGNDESARAARAVAALLAYAAEGHTPAHGAFRSHVARLLAFLGSVRDISDREKEFVDRAILAASHGNAPPGDWLALALAPRAPWSRIEELLR